MKATKKVILECVLKLATYVFTLRTEHVKLDLASWALKVTVSEYLAIFIIGSMGSGS